MLPASLDKAKAEQGVPHALGMAGASHRFVRRNRTVPVAEENGTIELICDVSIRSRTV
jgi:hypothetical protein